MTNLLNTKSQLTVCVLSVEQIYAELVRTPIAHYLQNQNLRFWRSVFFLMAKVLNMRVFFLQKTTEMDENGLTNLKTQKKQKKLKVSP